MPDLITRGADALADALRFFTRLPAPARFGAQETGPLFDGVAAAAPVAGVVVGAVSGATLALALGVGLTPLAGSAFATAAAVALCGALHEDAIADVADGFGGGRTREQKLAIMRDSAVGSYGAAALALALILRVALIAGLAEAQGPSAGLALVAAAALARPLALAPTRLLPPARTDGAGHAARPSLAAVLAGCGLGAAAALLAGGLAGGLVAILLAGLAVLGLSALSRRQIGGVTGDVCGAAAQVAEIAALAGLLMAAS
ncbi:adenosylcobinamide-GDP ribazoletransferase [Methylopila jiangsuensis]|uniref:Adenosylcobinamide-GDP ribazoletransferase n=1 Tax=Methylopila jiangsuensis TaxID=586230 RepID=A0A9W6JFK1_9HYPH|nr:adenosylcobinamide-GDP ribazoletransferase [Methylopila jiangsuensis]MDR6285348.1 adenosylcobinamide-GDP ribazoletransferase [Methylopila jiangsuensis]GLK75104.1 adenosylcobinamide-GDP ribazoletransferase [Methylopila jiangsuensis]